MFHRPAIDGMVVSPTTTAENRFARNGYGAPRVPRAYSPSSSPSFTVAASCVPYSSNDSVSAPFAKLPLVDVTLSSPLKNDPLTAAPSPAISNRNGISSWLTTTVASHRPATDCAAAGDGVAIRPARANSRPANAADVVLITSSSERSG